jgi:hypothetical protein
MEMLMLSMTGTVCLLIVEIAEVIRAWHAQRTALRVHPLATGSQGAATPVTLKKAA